MDKKNNRMATADRQKKERKTEEEMERRHRSKPRKDMDKISTGPSKMEDA